MRVKGARRKPELLPARRPYGPAPPSAARRGLQGRPGQGLRTQRKPISASAGGTFPSFTLKVT
jgi:hypothetical protein